MTSQSTPRARLPGERAGPPAEQDPALPVPRLFPTQQGDAVGRFSSEGVDYSTCLVSFFAGTAVDCVAAEHAPAAKPGGHSGPGRSSAAGFFSPLFDAALAWDVRHLPELAQFSGCIQSARCGRRRSCFRRLSDLPAAASRPAQSGHPRRLPRRQLAGGRRRPIDLRDSRLRRHDSCASDIRACGPRCRSY